jgi:alcohol dehydrogenase, propanol-preferring
LPGWSRPSGSPSSASAVWGTWRCSTRASSAAWSPPSTLEPGKLGLAHRLGADQIVNARTHDPVEEIKKAGGADVAVVLAAAPKAFEQAYKSLNRGGRLVMVALPADNAVINVPIFETVLGGISVIGSIVGTRQDLTEVFALHAAGRTQVIAETRRLDEVNDSFDQVLGGRAEARLVFEF